MNTHTPGPWHITSESVQYHYIHAPNNGIVAEVGKRSNVNGEGKANARLIAAAPELLSALKAALPAVEYMAEGESGLPVAVYRQVVAAIAKADPNGVVCPQAVTQEGE